MSELLSVVSAGEWRSCAHNAAFRGGDGHQGRRRWDQNAGGGSWDRSLLQKLWCPSNRESSHRYKRNKLTRYGMFPSISPLTVSVVLLIKSNLVKHFTWCYAHTHIVTDCWLNINPRPAVALSVHERISQSQQCTASMLSWWSGPWKSYEKWGKSVTPTLNVPDRQTPSHPTITQSSNICIGFF